VKTKVKSRKIQVIILSFGKFLTTIAAVISSIFLSRLLSLEEYANYRQSIFVYSFISPLLSLGFDKSMFYNFEKNRKNRGEQILNIQYVTLSLGVMFSIFFSIGGAGLLSKLFNNPNLEKGIIIYSIFAVLNLPTLVLQSSLIIKNEVKLLTVFNILNKVVSVAVTILVAYYYRDYYNTLISLLFVGILSFIVVQIILLKNFTKNISFRLNTNILKDYFKIGFPLLLASMTVVIGKNIDKLLISSMMTPVDFAIYAIGAIEIPLITSITGSVMVVVLTDFVKLLNKGDVKETFKLWNKAVETTSSILIPIMFSLLLNANWIIRLMYGDNYIDSVIPFRIYLLLLPMRAMVFTSLITASGNTKVISRGALIYMILNIILSTILIKTIGFSGPAIATVIVTYFLGIYYSYNISITNNVPIMNVFLIRKQVPYIIIGFVSLLIARVLTSYFSLPEFVEIIASNSIFIITMVIGVLVFKKEEIYINVISILKKN